MPIQENRVVEQWIKINSLIINRKLCHSICFDGVVKVFNLKASFEGINRIIASKLFLDFYAITDFGIFLREIKTPAIWPKTKLVYLDLRKQNLVDIYESNSSYHCWPVSCNKDQQLEITTINPEIGEKHGIIVSEIPPFNIIEY